MGSSKKNLNKIWKVPLLPTLTLFNGFRILETQKNTFSANKKASAICLNEKKNNNLVRNHTCQYVSLTDSTTPRPSKKQISFCSWITEENVVAQCRLERVDLDLVSQVALLLYPWGIQTPNSYSH